MKIAISTTMIQRGKTGIAEYLFSLVRHLEPHSKKHSLHLLVLEEDVPLFDFAKYFVRLVTVPERFRSPVGNIAWHQTRLPFWLHSAGMDVLHVPSFRRMLAIAPCAMVATIHDLAQFRIAGKYDPLRMFYGRVVARRLAHRQDRIIAISQNTARDIETFFAVDPTRVSVIHNGLDHERFSPGDGELARRAVAERHGVRGPFFLYLARLEHPGKNHVRLIEAFDQLKTDTQSPWQLVFAGSDWHGAEVVHQRIAASPFAKEIHPLGFVAPKDLPELYRAAGIFVYPSLYEGFGFPPLEAMACGCPVISSDRGSLKEVVGNAARIVDPTDVEMLSREMKTLAGDESIRESLRALGFQRAREFNWSKAAEATVEVYERAFAAAKKD